MKFALWLTKTVLTAAIVSVVSVATTWAVVNAYVQQLAGRFGAADMVGQVGLGDAITALVPGGGAAHGEAAPASSEPAGEGGSASPAGGTGGGASSAAEEEAPGDEYPVPDNALPVMGQAAESAEQFYISADELNEKKDSISDEDRMEIFAMLVTKLPPEEVQQISALMEDGLAADEMEQASDILQQYLSDEEYAQLLEILQKY